jgi:hypothetical protein
MAFPTCPHCGKNDTRVIQSVRLEGWRRFKCRSQGCLKSFKRAWELDGDLKGNSRLALTPRPANAKSRMNQITAFPKAPRSDGDEVQPVRDRIIFAFQHQTNLTMDQIKKAVPATYKVFDQAFEQLLREGEISLANKGFPKLYRCNNIQSRKSS